jgi:hypothetical protein
MYLPEIKLTYLESTNLLLNIIVQLTESRSISSVQRPQLSLKDRLVHNLANTDTSAGSLVTVARTNSLTGGADLATTQLSLLQTINNRVQVEADMRAVGDENALAGILQPLLFQRGQLLEEAGDVHDSSSTDEVNAGRRDQSRGKNMEVVSDVVMDDGVARIWRRKEKELGLETPRGGMILTVAASSTTAERSLLRKHICDLPLSYPTPTSISMPSISSATMFIKPHLHHPTGYPERS